MKDVLISVALTAIIVATIGITVFAIGYFHNQDKQHIKVQRVGCHQYRINEFTNEVEHLEGCNSVDHLNEEK